MNKQKQMKFKFFTNTIKAVEENGSRYIIGTASSTSIDRDGDRMSETALQTMKSTAEANLTLYTNHEYRIPDDLFGSCVEATIKAQRDETPIIVKSNNNDEEIYTFSPQELQIKIKVVSDSVNQKAGQIYSALQEGVNIGLSIGGAVKKIISVKDAVSGTIHNLIDSIDLYEISVVGIPANADAMNLAISKSVKGINIVEAETDDIDTIVKNTEYLMGKDKEYTLEGVKKYLVNMLKKYYDEYGMEVRANDTYIVDTETQQAKEDEETEEELEYKLERANYAKAEAENILARVGEKITVSSNDLHVIHLQSHSYELERLLQLGGSTETLAKHIKKHLSELQMKLDTQNNAE